jgi:hypothetical protein
MRFLECVAVVFKYLRTAGKGRSSSLGLGQGLTTPHHKNSQFWEPSHGTSVFLVKWFSSDKIKKNDVGGHVACMGQGEVRIEFCQGNLKERTDVEELGVDGKII